MIYPVMLNHLLIHINGIFHQITTARLAFNVSFISCTIALQVGINEIILIKILMVDQDWTLIICLKNLDWLCDSTKFEENVPMQSIYYLNKNKKLKVHFTISGTCAVQRTQKLKTLHWNSEKMINNKSQKRVIAATNNYTLAIQQYQVWIRFNWRDKIGIF